MSSVIIIFRCPQNSPILITPVDMIEKWIITTTTTTTTKEAQLQCHQQKRTCLHHIVHPVVANPQLKSRICVMTIIFIITIVIITIVITNLVQKWK